MEVILDNEHKPRGVFLPLAEWETLKPGIDEASDLYKLMDELCQPDVFDMNAQQFSEYLAPVVEQTVLQALDDGLYFSYPADSNEFPEAFVHEYKNGRKVLIRIDSKTGKEHFIKEF